MFPLVEPVLLVLAAWAAAAVHWSWPGSLTLRRAGGRLVAWARLSPASAVMWLIVLLHATMLAALPAGLQEAVLRSHSTNLRELDRHPVSVLVSSALWTDLGELPFATLAALLVWSPAERWLGTPKMLLAFWTGHVGASILSATRAAHLFSRGMLGRDFTDIVDVGVSLGTLTLAALLVYRLRHRLLAAVVLVAVVWSSVLVYGRYTTIGHLLSLAIGFALWPLTRGARDGVAWIRTGAVVREQPP